MRFTVLADNFVSRSIAFKNREDVTAPVEQALVAGDEAFLFHACSKEKAMYLCRCIK
jgi:hypothetical protein